MYEMHDPDFKVLGVVICLLYTSDAADEEDIRRISGKTLIVADEHGVQFLIRDLPALDRHSRKLLDRFL